MVVLRLMRIVQYYVRKVFGEKLVNFWNWSDAASYVGTYCEGMNLSVTLSQIQPLWERMDEKIDDQFLTRKSFSSMVETFVYQNRMSYLDSVLHLCEKNTLELDDVKKYLSITILEHIESEARQLNFLPKQNTLDV